MGLSQLDRQLALNYLPQLLATVKYGESGVFFWFPGSGMTTIVQDVFSNKILWNSFLSGLANRQKVFHFWGHLADKKTYLSLFKSTSFVSTKDIQRRFNQVLDQGNEVICVVGRIDNYPEQEKISILKELVKLNAINRRRIHILFLSTNKPWFLKVLVSNPEIASIANRIELMPIISGDLLRKYIQQRAFEFDFHLTAKEISTIQKTYGGVLTLTKEILRSKGKINSLELKLGLLWKFIPEEYKKIIQNRILIKSRGGHSDLDVFGVSDLKLFKAHWKAINHDPNQLLPKLLTPEEMDLWKHISDRKGEIVDKDSIAAIIRPHNSDNVSLWAIDQAVSRFRKKLAKTGIDPDQLITLKGKGYIWKG